MNVSPACCKPLRPRRQRGPDPRVESGAQYLETAIDLARAAGDVLNHYSSRDKLVEFKGPANLVTIADKESEELIIGGILRRYPSHSILAEESGATQPGAS